NDEVDWRAGARDYRLSETDVGVHGDSGRDFSHGYSPRKTEGCQRYFLLGCSVASQTIRIALEQGASSFVPIEMLCSGRPRTLRLARREPDAREHRQARVAVEARVGLGERTAPVERRARG